jgi:ATP-binding cassette, subfamily B, bacterial
VSNIKEIVSGNRTSEVASGDNANSVPRRDQARGPRELIGLIRRDKTGDPIVPLAPTATALQLFRAFWPYTKGYRRWLLVSLGFAMVKPMLDVSAIWAFKILIDDVVVPGNLDRFPAIAAVYVAIAIAVGVTGLVDSTLSTYIAGRFLLDLRTDVFRHMQRLSPDVFDRRRPGDLLSRLSSDISAIESLVMSSVTKVIARGAMIVVFAIALLVLHWELAIAAFSIAPLFILISRRFARAIKQASRERRQHSGALSAVAEESLSNMAVVQIYNQQEAEAERFHIQGRRNLGAQMRSSLITGVYSPVVGLIEFAGVLIVFGVGAWQIQEDRMTLGGLLAFSALVSRLYSPVRSLARLRNTIASASAGAERVLEILDEVPLVADRSDAREIRDGRGEIEFDQVCFHYPGADRTALRNVTLRIPAGSTVALVGRSGAGKSTVARLIVRFYDPTAGTTRMDGRDIRSATLQSLRDRVTLLLQDTLVFDGSLRENIRYGRPDATDDEVASAANAADMDEFVARLPDGLDSLIGQKGRRLSGGQRQRLAVARAFVRDAPVLILDEPTTGLDARSSHRVLEPIRRLVEGRTTILISHDLLATAWADEIIVFDEGTIIGRGTHERLLVTCDLYRELVDCHSVSTTR